jgi:hypothetical protein
LLAAEFGSFVAIVTAHAADQGPVGHQSQNRQNLKTDKALGPAMPSTPLAAPN